MGGSLFGVGLTINMPEIDVDFLNDALPERPELRLLIAIFMRAYRDGTVENFMREHADIFELICDGLGIPPEAMQARIKRARPHRINAEWR